MSKQFLYGFRSGYFGLLFYWFIMDEKVLGFYLEGGAVGLVNSDWGVVKL